jgi:iron complex outermembrane receptor protein
MIFKPVEHPNFAAGFSYFNIVSSNRVLQTQSVPLDVLSNPQESWLVQRNVSAADRAQVCSRSQFYGTVAECLDAPIGAIVDIRLRNVETVRTDGFDASSRYAHSTRAGYFNFDLDATYMLRFRESQSPTGVLQELRGTPHSPPGLQLHSSMGWELRGISVRPAVNFQNSYTDYFSYPVRDVGSWTTCDLVLGYKLRSYERSSSAETNLALRGQNIFNVQPPFLNNGLSGIGYDPENADLLGRRVSISLEHRW